MLDKLFGARTVTLGSKFPHLCVAGLNRAELLVSGSDTSVTGESWQDITDEQTRRRMALVFFAPRELDGQPMPPAQLLADDPEDEESIALMAQSLGNIPQIDLCRMPPAEPGHVNFLVAADVIYHWDSSDNYIVPTDTLSWAKDIQRILKTYPKNTQSVVYTVWDPEKVGDVGLPVQPLRNLPFALETWVNVPTVQEKMGTHVLVAALFVAVLAWVGLHAQSSQMEKLDEMARITEQKIPREAGFRSLSRFMKEQKKFMEYRLVLPYVVKDVAHAMQVTGMKAVSLEVENPNPLEPSDTFVARIEGQKDAYQGWLQEEPVAKNFLLASAAVSAIRKPPGNAFKLEGLLDMKQLKTDIDAALQEKEALEALENDAALETEGEG